jgi:hypothetical protein
MLRQLPTSTLQSPVAQILLAVVVFFPVQQGRNLTQVQKDRFCADLITH